MRLASLLLIASYALGTVHAQDTTGGAPSQSLTSSSFTFTDISTTVTTTLSPSNTRSRGTPTILTTAIRSSYALSQSPTTTASAANATQTSQEPEPIHLDTKIDPAFGVLGALLILTGLPSAFWGHKNRWTSFFLIGFYTLSLICFVLITRFGILQAVNPPSKAVRGLFLLACAVAGVAGGGISIFFWQHSKYFIGAWGGLAFSWWIQCLHNGGVIKPVGFRWLFFIACAVIGFVLCTIPKIHYHILLVSTAAVGATAFILGVDCFTTAGLKEFYVHNLGFDELFPKFANMQFPVSQTMQIEIGLIGAVALMGGAVQLRILVLLQAKLREIGEDQKRREAELDAKVARRYNVVERDLEAWEKEHGNGRVRESMGIETPTLAENGGEGRDSSQFSLLGLGKSRQQSLGQDSLPKLLHTPAEERPQSVALPELDLGNRRDDDLGGGLTIPEDDRPTSSIEDDPELKEKLKLLAEIRNMRKSIDALRANSNESSSSGKITPPIQPSVPTVPMAPLPPAVEDAVARRKAMEAIYQNDGKEAYHQVTMRSSLDTRKERTSGEMLPSNWMNTSGSSNKKHHGPPSPQRMAHSRSKSAGGPVVILPPARTSTDTKQSPTEPAPPRVHTYEEYTERHRSKMRELQEPLTKAEEDQAKLNAAKSRWERSLAVEKIVMERRESEALAQKKAREKAGSPKDGNDSDEDVPLAEKKRHSRSHSRNKLPGEEGSTKRHSSALKVQEWQKHHVQHERRHSGSAVPAPAPGPSTKRLSGRMEDFNPPASVPVPFPSRTSTSPTDPNFLEHRRKSSGRSFVLDRWNQYSPPPGTNRPPPN
ncbi:hypothetical protein FRC02_001487 [Tulasnella sp. 418]|nr:hypothetical protein FRC02_001487 [Tulasnella sp. 418]